MSKVENMVLHISGRDLSDVTMFFLCIEVHRFNPLPAICQSMIMGHIKIPLQIAETVLQRAVLTKCYTNVSVCTHLCFTHTKQYFLFYSMLVSLQHPNFLSHQS